jgi:hypothetical protein
MEVLILEKLHLQSFLVFWRGVLGTEPELLRYILPESYRFNKKKLHENV